MEIADSFLEFSGLARKYEPAVGTSRDNPLRPGAAEQAFARQPARPFVSHADEKASRIGMTQPPSLARFVRQTLEKRRAEMLTGWAGKS